MLATVFPKNEVWSINPYCAEIVSGSSDSFNLFLRVTLFTISNKLTFFQESLYSLNLKLGTLWKINHKNTSCL